MRTLLLIVALSLAACKDHPPPAFTAGTVVHHKADNRRGVVSYCEHHTFCRVTLGGDTMASRMWYLHEIVEQPEPWEPSK